MTGPIPIRVTVLDTWDEIPLMVDPETPIVELKRETLSLAHVRQPPAGYVIKHLGIEVPEGDTTVDSAGIGPNAALIVLSRRKIPTR